LPIILYYFNSLPLISLAANIPVIPLSGVILMGGFAAVLAEAVLPGLGVRALEPVGALLTLLIKMVHGFRPTAVTVGPVSDLCRLRIALLLAGDPGAKMALGSDRNVA